MERVNLRVLAAFGLLFLLAGPGRAAPPPGGTVPGPGGDKRTTPDAGNPPEEYQGLGVSHQLTAFSGSVLDVNDRALPGVEVKLFIDGALVAATSTDSDGTYDLGAPYNAYDETTVLLWYVGKDRSLLPKALVVRESKASHGNALISKCVPRATLTPGRRFRVYLFDALTRNKDVAESGCLP